MATPKTGKPRGRPRNPGLPAVRRGKCGRPPESIAQDPDRHFKALTQALIDMQPHSALKIAETMCGLRYGQPLQESIGPMLRGESFPVFADPRQGDIPHGGNIDIDSSDHGEHWRDHNIFRPQADALLRELHDIREGKRQGAGWLGVMSVAWQSLRYDDPALLLGAERAAEAIGEATFFRERMLPIAGLFAALRAAGLDGASLPLPWLLDIIRR